MEGLAGVGCDAGRKSKYNTSMKASRASINSSKIGVSKEARAKGERRRKGREEGERKHRASLLPWCLGRKAGQKRVWERRAFSPAEERCQMQGTV
jgi:hypothetical protein